VRSCVVSMWEDGLVHRSRQGCTFQGTSLLFEGLHTQTNGAD
jgi:hypothetical protein